MLQFHVRKNTRKTNRCITSIRPVKYSVQDFVFNTSWFQKGPETLLIHVRSPFSFQSCRLARSRGESEIMLLCQSPNVNPSEWVDSYYMNYRCKCRQSWWNWRKVKNNKKLVAALCPMSSVFILGVVCVTSWGWPFLHHTKYFRFFVHDRGKTSLLKRVKPYILVYWFYSVAVGMSAFEAESSGFDGAHTWRLLGAMKCSRSAVNTRISSLWDQ